MDKNITNMFTDEEIENNKNNKKKNMLNQFEEFHEHNDEEDYPQQKGIMDDPDEYKHFKEIVSTFFNYQV